MHAIGSKARPSSVRAAFVTLAIAVWHHRLMPGASQHHLSPRERSGLVRLRRVRDRMDREFALPLSVEELARSVNMSAGHLSRRFKLAYGESPYSYLMTRRVERAMALLRGSDLSVTDVCFEVGCSSLGSFSTKFTELVGVPPSVYREQQELATAGMPACVAKRVTRPASRAVRRAGRQVVRNREAPARNAALE